MSFWGEMMDSICHRDKVGVLSGLASTRRKASRMKGEEPQLKLYDGADKALEAAGLSTRGIE